MKSIYLKLKAYVATDDLIARVTFVYLGLVVLAVNVALFLIIGSKISEKIILTIFVCLPLQVFSFWLINKFFSKQIVELPIWRGEGSGSGSIVGEAIVFLANILLIILAIPVAYILRKQGINGKQE